MNKTASPLVSVLIPSYNHSKYVIECLESVKGCDYGCLELIVVDDGSTDNSADLIDTWLNCNNSYFVRVVFIQQENAGICKTANRLIKLAQGDFLVFVASDDKLLSEGISSRVEALQENLSWLAVYGDCILIDSEGEIIANSAMTYLYKANKLALINSNFIARELILHWSVPGPGFMARKVCYDTRHGVGIYNENLSIEDRDYYLRLLSKSALGYIDFTVAAYRIHGSNISRNEEFRPSLNCALQKSNIYHVNDFKGFTKICLKVVTFYYHYAFLYRENKNIYNLLMLVVAKTLKLISSKIHSFMVYFNLSGPSSSKLASSREKQLPL